MGTSAAHWSNRCAICKQCGMDGATRSSKSWFDLVSFPGGLGTRLGLIMIILLKDQDGFHGLWQLEALHHKLIMLLADMIASHNDFAL